ncbi:JAB domain-containing protein [Acetobacter estunensis]|nr:JAB domain-containing protein [Acetobacter estunensis]
MTVSGPTPSIGNDTSPALPFVSTGPTGHRKRMRERVVAKGAGALADYELLEMLLYFGFPRGDTKPRAKALINRFTTFAGVLEASDAALREEGLETDALAALRLVTHAARRMGEADRLERPSLGNWEELLAYFDTALAGAVPGQLRALFLDNRNRLLGDEAIESVSEVRDAVAETRLIFTRALELHATALILIRPCPDGQKPEAVIRGDEVLATELQRAGKLLAITVHDVFALRGGQWASLKQMGRLKG